MYFTIIKNKIKILQATDYSKNEFYITFKNILNLATPAYLEVFLRSICFAFLATVICFVIAYPVAYFISRTSPKAQKILVMLVMLPQWLNFLIRTYSWCHDD